MTIRFPISRYKKHCMSMQTCNKYAYYQAMCSSPSIRAVLPKANKLNRKNTSMPYGWKKPMPDTIEDKIA